ncbi:2Fe-2S iron-sulfur cluster-binding protein [Methylobacterium sp. Leaf89]|uniref:(2Fe-2S)-binding protein n=1 Tax=Methylobacterium sp. Leaf89 TaxID=1736245 RepID=UPI0006F6BFE1|nr:2Fe-2S iron-sulfur cluster-binding protein [Methylobacterium sp. Leaf89]KQO73586.1 (2Fe-2S)-binding protein [Methylobacterium sp. Leaf89]
MNERRYRLNGQTCADAGPPERRLLDILREDHALTAAKPGCGIGRCGACTVLVDGLPVNACLVMAYRLDGREIVTAEVASGWPEMAIVRAALIAENAFQCGYCAPGITFALAALLRRAPESDDGAIRAALVGHLCRCTGYTAILRAAARVFAGP